jgi:hypothetical protein
LPPDSAFTKFFDGFTNGIKKDVGTILLLVPQLEALACPE